jgi:hypothetical protein
MAQTTRVQLFQLASKSKQLTVAVNDHDDSFTVAKLHPTTNKIVESYRCFVSGQCLELTDGPAIPCTPHEVAIKLGLI